MRSDFEGDAPPGVNGVGPPLSPAEVALWHTDRLKRLVLSLESDCMEQRKRAWKLDEELTKTLDHMNAVETFAVRVYQRLGFESGASGAVHDDVLKGLDKILLEWADRKQELKQKDKRIAQLEAALTKHVEEDGTI